MLASAETTGTDSPLDTRHEVTGIESTGDAKPIASTKDDALSPGERKTSNEKRRKSKGADDIVDDAPLKKQKVIEDEILLSDNDDDFLSTEADNDLPASNDKSTRKNGSKSPETKKNGRIPTATLANQNARDIILCNVPGTLGLNNIQSNMDKFGPIDSTRWIANTRNVVVTFVSPEGVKKLVDDTQLHEEEDRLFCKVFWHEYRSGHRRLQKCTLEFIIM